VRLCQRDVRDALDFVHAASSADSSEPFAEPVVELLGRIVPGEFVDYSEWSTAEGPRVTMAVEHPVVSIPPDVVEARREYCCSYPLSVMRRSSAKRALKVSDFLSLRELHRLDYYDSVLRPFRIEHQMRLWLSAPTGTARFFSFSRLAGQRDFGERERSLLELLRPSLVAIRDRFEPPTNGVSLTEREEEILRWVARGKTNQEIAALLVVSPHTVRKHLENAYEKLGVHTRTAAIAYAFAGRG
jgi:DNA-binding CsgD family transcriptional regulator